MKHDDAPLGQILGGPPTADQLDKLARFEELLLGRALPLGFVSEPDEGQVWARHILDSARAAPLVPAGSVLDLGSGAGLPGIVLAILRSDVVVHLVEAQRRRLAFLELAVESLSLGNAVPVGGRVKDVGDGYTGALARAFADPERSWAMAEPHLAAAGRLVYFAGRTFEPTRLDTLGVRVRTVPAPPLLASSGPLVIMSRA